MTRRHARLVVVRPRFAEPTPTPSGGGWRLVANTAILLAFLGAMAVIDHFAHL